MVNRYMLFVIFNVLFSCKSKTELCFKKNINFDNKLFNVLIDTNFIYIKQYVTDVNDAKSKFIENENILIKNKKPCIVFSGNGKYKYFYDFNSFENSRKTIIGKYRFSNDTIFTCREYYSAQAGKYFGNSIMIVKDSIIEEKSFPTDNGIISSYIKTSKTKK